MIERIINKVRKDGKIYRLTVSKVALADHYKFLNIFMIYEMYKARNLFNYLFLSHAIYSCESLNSSLPLDKFTENTKEGLSDKLTLQEMIEDFSIFYDLVRSFVNSNEVRTKIGEFNLGDSIDQDGSFPLLVPIK